MRLSRSMLRALALVLLAAALVGVPLIVFRLVGPPFPGWARLSETWRSRTVDESMVISIGTSVFAALWAWFAITALAELWHVLKWRFGGEVGSLAPLPPGPSGWVRSLVRFIAISSVTASAVVSSLVPTVRASAVVPSAPSAVMHSVSVAMPTADPAQVHHADGRQTPYSLAAALGRPELRDSIIQLNAGRLAPDGLVWQGGVFPAGMEVVLPAEQAVHTLLGPAHTVVAGDSYWRIADDHLTIAMGRDATPREVHEYTGSLMGFNGDLLGHDDPALLLPGELVIFTDTAATPAAAPALDDEVVVPVVVPAPVVQVVEVVETVVLDTSATSAADRLPGVGGGTSGPDRPMTPERPVAVEPEVAGEVSRVDVAAEPVVAVSADDSSGALAPYAAGLAGAVMMSAGALGLLESRRRRQLRSASVGARLAPPTLRQACTEIVLRALDPGERLARLDLAVRSAAPTLASQAASVTAALVRDDGEIVLFVRGAATPDDAQWQLDLHANTWRLSSGVSLVELATRARESGQPCPAMAHLGGALEGGELFVDLEALGTLSVLSPHAPAILRHLAASLALSPFLGAARVLTVGLGDVRLGSSNSEPFDSLDAALEAAGMALGSTASLTRQATTFALRTVGAGGEAWEPAVVVAAVATVSADGDELWRAMPRGGRGLAVVLDVACGDDGWQLRSDGDGHVLEPLGVRVRPVGVTADEVAEVAELLQSANELPAPEELLGDIAVPAVVGPVAGDSDGSPVFEERDWAVMVRVLGRVDVASRAGVVAECERSKATELIVWLSQHRERPTRSAARTALWDLEVRDATFANVVSDARRAMARATPPPEGEEWVGRTLTDDLPLHPSVVTDAELLAARVAHARGLASIDAVEVLRPGVALLAGMPFAGSNFLWPDAEGTTSSLVLLATGAAIELANHCLALGDVDGVFWATGQGLKVLSGHEELIALRMRAHARRGDLAGVRNEWETYERALAADSWAAAEPAPKLVALRRELLAPTHSMSAGGA